MALRRLSDGQSLPAEQKSGGRQRLRTPSRLRAFKEREGKGYIAVPAHVRGQFSWCKNGARDQTSPIRIIRTKHMSQSQHFRHALTQNWLILGHQPGSRKG
eukprot:980400-Pelagomonas_calceolata.AAC.3